MGRHVRQLREQRGLTQTQLGVLANLGSGNQSLIAKLEAGQRPIRVNEVDALAAALGVPLAVLLERSPTQEVARAAAALERAQLALEEILMRQMDLDDEMKKLAPMRERYIAEITRCEARLQAAKEKEDRGEPREEA
ncbi:helix-turn-helix domain-containing protein [Modestobacter sp. Leaf380]|uniref:helix-turn-helix domain-containing protein n=1 Tax=Modestobacter sp. Leaf380 TaxID=1736356 RepID=UPI0006FAB613|nr:helix-turn-helix transcriptional regulator [Modestobacter sp. Leaf380]KQS66326.1 hypothetical protein ASG41_13535 [Modestobacter sp. Leaf380]